MNALRPLAPLTLIAMSWALTSCGSRNPHVVPELGSTDWFEAVDSILELADPAGHGPDLDSEEWRRAVHRRLPDKSSSMALDDVGTDAWFRHVDEVVFWLYRSPPQPDWVYTRNLPDQAWELDVWQPEGSTPEKRWYRLAVKHDDGTTAHVLHPYDGRIVGHWVTDLDRNGRREIVLAIQSFGTGAYGNVVIHEWTGTRLRRVGGNAWRLPGDGYMGHDTIQVAVDKIIRTFPVYLDGDSNSRPSGGKAVIRYGLQNGSLREIARHRID